LQKFPEPRRIVQNDVGQEEGRQGQKKYDEIDEYDADA
jgi:hypothetical protein